MRRPKFASFSRAARAAAACALAPLAVVAPQPAFAACPPPDAAPIVVTGVEDARTLLLRDGTRLRLAGIEPAAAFLGDPADDPLPARLATLAEGQALRVRAVADKPDRHGRVPALLFLDGGDLLQERLAAEGIAIVFATEPDLPCLEDIRAAERAARRNRAGAWRTAGPLPAGDPDAVAARTGRFAILEGRVVSVGNRYSATYLDFGRSWSSDVTVRIDRADRKSFGGEEALSALEGRDILVRGYVVSGGGPLIQARSPAAIEILATPREELLPLP